MSNDLNRRTLIGGGAAVIGWGLASPTHAATAPTAASLFPAFTAAGPFQPIIYNATQMPGKPYG